MVEVAQEEGDAECYFVSVLEAADGHWSINFSKERGALHTVGALLRVVALLKNRRSPGAPQAPERKDCQDVLLPAETKQDLAQSRRGKHRGKQPTACWR